MRDEAVVHVGPLDIHITVYGGDIEDTLRELIRLIKNDEFTVTITRAVTTEWVKQTER